MFKVFNNFDLAVKNKELVGVSVKVTYDTDIRSIEVHDITKNKRMSVNISDISPTDIAYLKRMLNI